MKKININVTRLTKIAEQTLEGFARNANLEVTDLQRETFSEDVISYVQNFGLTPERAAEVAWQALCLTM